MLKWPGKVSGARGDSALSVSGGGSPGHPRDSRTRRAKARWPRPRTGPSVRHARGDRRGYPARGVASSTGTTVGTGVPHVSSVSPCPSCVILCVLPRLPSSYDRVLPIPCSLSPRVTPVSLLPSPCPLSPVFLPCPSKSSCPHCVPHVATCVPHPSCVLCPSVSPVYSPCPLCLRVSHPVSSHCSSCPLSRPAPSPSHPTFSVSHSPPCPSCHPVPPVPSLSQLHFSFPEATAASAFGVWVTPPNTHGETELGGPPPLSWP